MLQHQVKPHEVNQMAMQWLEAKNGWKTHTGIRTSTAGWVWKCASREDLHPVMVASECPSQVWSMAKHNTGRWMMRVFACVPKGTWILSQIYVRIVRTLEVWAITSEGLQRWTVTTSSGSLHPLHSSHDVHVTRMILYNNAANVVQIYISYKENHTYSQ